MLLLALTLAQVLGDETLNVLLAGALNMLASLGPHLADGDGVVTAGLLAGSCGGRSLEAHVE